MAVRSVLYFPDPRLRKKADPVTDVSDETRKLVGDMFETMYADRGVGLAATQINVQQQIIVIDTSLDKSAAFCLINPKILQKTGQIESEEGCLSLPGVYAKVLRAAEIEVEFLNQQGEKQQLKADGLLAYCIQHEMDHLVGKLFIDYLSPLKQQRVRKKLEKIRRKTL